MQHGIIDVQITALTLKQPNLGYINPGFLQCCRDSNVITGLPWFTNTSCRHSHKPHLTFVIKYCSQEGLLIEIYHPIYWQGRLATAYITR